MTEEQIDNLTIKILGTMIGIAKWLVVQYALLCILPLMHITFPNGTLWYTAVCTIVFNVYLAIVPKEGRLRRVWLPCVTYLFIAVACSYCLGRISFWGIVLPPLYGLACYILVRKSKKYWKTGTWRKRSAMIAGIACAIVLLRISGVYWECRDHGTFDSEKEEILQRSKYLESKLATTPQKVLDEMPMGIGEQFQGEWALYSCSMYTSALVNISRLYPDTRQDNLQTVDKLIQIVLSPELRKYDTQRWEEDALEHLDSQKSHISYISHLAWMIGGYKSIGGGPKYDGLYDSLCEAMNRRILNSSTLNLPTYPGEPIYIPDMLVAIVALQQYARQHERKYVETVNKWVESAREHWCDPETGLLVSFLGTDGAPIDGAPVKGSYSALNCSYLTMIDEPFAREQYAYLKKNFWKPKGVLRGFSEYRNSSPLLALDIDAGPVIMGLSPSGTAFATGAATYFGDDEVRTNILRTAEIAGNTIYRGGKRHYALADIALVGEAVMLAMRTQGGRGKSEERRMKREE